MNSQIPEGVCMFKSELDSVRQGLAVIKRNLRDLQAMVATLESKLR